MMLDLVIDGKIKLEKAVSSKTIMVSGTQKADGEIMPMSMKEAVPSARYWHNEFYDYMPEGYVYDPNSSDNARANELLGRESYLTTLWMDSKVIPNCEDLLMSLFTSGFKSLVSMVSRPPKNPCS